MKEKTDLRIIKTKKILFDTLIKLMKQKNFERIKISDICEEALINRSTFYAHYEDKYDLLMDLFEEQKLALLKELNVNENKSFSKKYLMDLLSILINHIDENKLNNRADNLEWCNRKINNHYSKVTERLNESKKKAVDQYDMDWNFIQTISGVREAARIVGAKCHDNISRCCNGEQKYCKGFKWKWHED